MRTPAVRDPAVVLNPGTAGVGIIHALGIAGVPIITVGRRWPPLLGRFSKFPFQHFTYDANRESLDTVLLRVSEQIEGRGVLFPAIDMDLEVLVRERERLAERFHVPAAPHIGKRIFDKDWQYELAAKTGVPIPRTLKFRAGETPDIAEMRFPLIVKPTARTAESGGKAFRLRVMVDHAEWTSCLNDLAAQFPGKEFQLAENIPGEPTQLHTVGCYADRSGRVLRTYTGRKVSQRPYTHGDASIAETIPPDPRVVGYARALLEAARFHGISQVEFKLDPRDGEYRLMEINGRSWSWVKLPAFSGVNLPLIQYYDLTGDPRLQEALSSPQRHEYFLVRDFLVRLNDLDVERKAIAELSRSKQRVSAVELPSEPLLNGVHRLASFLIAYSGGSLEWLTRLNRSADKLQESVDSHGSALP